jgi:hypothetical protein
MNALVLAAALGSSGEAELPFPTLRDRPAAGVCFSRTRISQHPGGIRISSFAVAGHSIVFDLSHDLMAGEHWAAVSLDGQPPVFVRFGDRPIHYAISDLASGRHTLYASVVTKGEVKSVEGTPEGRCFEVAR